jgi:tRNA (cmo5U34)-methyltransferase
MEISQKREALESVLIPETVESHLERLTRVGFKAVDIWLKWFNFASFIALKDAL